MLVKEARKINFVRNACAYGVLAHICRRSSPSSHQVAPLYHKAVDDTMEERALIAMSAY